MKRFLFVSMLLVAVAALAPRVNAQGQGRGPGRGVGPNFVDANGDGICDHFQAGGRGDGAVGNCAWCGLGANNASLVDVAATTLGHTRAGIVSELRQGKTLAQVMEANGRTPNELVEAVVADRKAALDRAVAANSLTAQQASEALARIRTHVEQTIAQPWPLRGGGAGFGHHGRHGWRW